MSRLELIGAQAKLKQKRFDLAQQAKTHIKAIKSLLASSVLQPISEIDIEGTLIHAQAAAEIKNEYAQILTQLGEIEKELEE